MSDWAKGRRFSPMALLNALPTLRSYRPGPAAQLALGLSCALAVALVAVGPDRLLAQIEGERGILPTAVSRDIQVNGITVETTGKNAEDARLAGWRMAQRKAWEQLGGPAIPDGQLDGMVAAVVIEREQIGPRRYIATLGVIFDRTRAGQFIGGGPSAVAHSAPMLVIPVLYSGGTGQVYEVRGPWQRAWAEFRAGASSIDYVRPVGAGGDSLVFTAGQPTRRSRLWWRTLLDQYGAADVLIPVARLERQWPGGPVRGTFTARYGPDNEYLDSFTLTANGEAGVPAMLNAALKRMDTIYTDALVRGMLKPDPTLMPPTPVISSALQAIIDAGQRAPEGVATTSEAAPLPSAGASPVPGPTATAVATFTVQFASPDARAVDGALAAVRGAPGVQGASTSSIAIGGTSVMRVTFAGDLDALAAALRARGFAVTVGNNALSIRR